MRRLIFGLCLLLAASGRGAEIRINFSDAPPGSVPTNFRADLVGGGPPARWQIVLDEVPPLLAPLTDQAPSVTKRAVLAQTSQDPTGERFPLFIYEGDTFNDFTFSTRFKLVGGVAEQMAGVVFRFQNTSNFYVVRASALGKNIAFYKMINGQIVAPIKLPLEITTNVWHELKIDCSGVYIECSLDGQKVLPTITDKTPPEGKLGFWTKSDAVSYFCDPLIQYTLRIPAAQALVDDILQKQPRILGVQIYTLNGQGNPRIIASKDKKEIGEPGTDAEKDAINNGKTFYAKNRGAVTVTLPFRDRNGDPMAAVRVRLDSFFGETQQNALTRATMILKKMQGAVDSSEQLLR